MSKNTELHEMSLRRLARLSAMEGSAETSPEVEEKEKAASSPLNTDVEVNIQPQPPNKAGASQISLKTDSCIETIEITTDKSTTQYLTNRNRATISANYESSPGQIIASLQTILSVSLPGSDYSSPQCFHSCPQAFSLAPSLAPSDLVGVVLAEAVSAQSPQASVRYLVNCHSRHRSEEAQCGKRGRVPPLSTIFTSSKSQIVSTLSNVLKGVWSSPPPTNSSPLYSLLNEEQLPPDLLPDLVSLLGSDPAALSPVFSPLLQHCLAETRRGKVVSSRYLAPLISLTRLAEVRLSSGSRPLADLLVTQPQWIPAEITQAGGLEVAGLSFLGKEK